MSDIEELKEFRHTISHIFPWKRYCGAIDKAIEILEREQARWTPVIFPRENLPRDRRLWVTVDDAWMKKELGWSVCLGEPFVIDKEYTSAHEEDGYFCEEYTDELMDYIVAYMEFDDCRPTPYTGFIKRKGEDHGQGETT